MSKQFEKDKHFVKECVKWFVHNGIPVDRIRVEITPQNVVVLTGSESITKKPLVQVLYRTRNAKHDFLKYRSRVDERAQRAIRACLRYRDVLATVKAEPIEPWSAP